MARFSRRWVIGRRIVDVQMRPFNDGKGGVAHDPVFVLDNGARVRFLTQETEVGEYGVEPLYDKPHKARGR